jgi:hypothetical protein
MSDLETHWFRILISISPTSQQNEKVLLCICRVPMLFTSSNKWVSVTWELQWENDALKRNKDFAPELSTIDL